MGASIDQFNDRATRQQEQWRRYLRTSVPLDQVAVQYYTWKLMNSDLQNPNSLVQQYGNARQGVLQGADVWRANRLTLASLEFDQKASPDDPDGSKWAARLPDYFDFAQRMIRAPQVRTTYTEDPANGVGYIIRENPDFPKYFQLIKDEFIEWAQNQRRTKIFLMQPPAVAYNHHFLVERPDIVALLREAQQLPMDVEHTEVDVPTAIEVAEGLIGLIPVVGNMTAAYESYTGQNLFGYHLTDVARAVLAASILLPVAGRLVREGRVLYTEARLASIYGRDAGQWSNAVSQSTGLLQDVKSATTIEKAEATIKSGSQLDAALAKDADQAVQFLNQSSSINQAVDQSVSDALTKLKQTHAVFQTLDQFAVERVLLKGSHLPHLKGQLLEELLESRLVPSLSKRSGGFALGLEVPAAKKLEFLPGYAVRDLQSHALSDGLLGYRENGVFQILAVFECKAGKEAARELSFARATISGLNDAEKAELRAFAKDEFRAQRAMATKAGQPFTKSVDDVEKEIIQSERGGQVRRDIERLSKDDKILVGTDELPINFSPTKTKFFAVVPNDLSARRILNIKSALDAEKVTYEIIDGGLSTKQLDDAADGISQLAGQFVGGPVPLPGIPPAPAP